MVDRKLPLWRLAGRRVAPGFVERIFEMVRRKHYNRRMPVIAKLSHLTVDRDFRYARDWGT